MLLFGAVFMLCVLMSSRPAAAQTPAPSVTVTPSAPSAANAAETNADEVLARADKAIDYASRVTDQASMVLGFIQGISILFGVIASAGGILLGANAFRTLREYDSQLKAMRDQLADEATKAADLRTNLQRESSEGLNQFLTNAMGEITRAQQRAEDMTRALTLLQLGELQTDAGNRKTAIKAYEEAFALDPRNRATNYQLGELYIIERQLDKAIQHLELALKEDPNFAPAIAAIGYAMRLQGDKLPLPDDKNQMWAQSEQKLLEAIKIDPNVRDSNRQPYYANLAALYKRQGRVQDAIIYYEKAQELVPDSSYPISNLAQLYFMQGNLDKGRAYFQRSLANAQRSVNLNPQDFWGRFDMVTAELALEADPAWRQDMIAVLRQSPTGPLDSLMNGLINLKQTPHPPSRIDEAIQMVRDEIERRQQGNGN
jgi:tetratricopeptide (TPR) repeat protein